MRDGLASYPGLALIRPLITPKSQIAENPALSLRFRASICVSLARPVFVENLGCMLIRREKGLNREFRQGNINGRPEDRDRADKG
jgi:hypothetical protein